MSPLSLLPDFFHRCKGCSSVRLSSGMDCNAELDSSNAVVDFLWSCSSVHEPFFGNDKALNAHLLDHENLRAIFLNWCEERTHNQAIPHDERLRCPLLWCRQSFWSPVDALLHVHQCEQLTSGAYWCPIHQRPERFLPQQQSQVRSPAHVSRQRIVQKTNALVKRLGRRFQQNRPPAGATIIDSIDNLGIPKLYNDSAFIQTVPPTDFRRASYTSQPSTVTPGSQSYAQSLRTVLTPAEPTELVDDVFALHTANDLSNVGFSPELSQSYQQGEQSVGQDAIPSTFDSLPNAATTEWLGAQDASSMAGVYDNQQPLEQFLQPMSVEQSQVYLPDLNDTIPAQMPMSEQDVLTYTTDLSQAPKHAGVSFNAPRPVKRAPTCIGINLARHDYATISDLVDGMILASKVIMDQTIAINRAQSKARNARSSSEGQIPSPDRHLVMLQNGLRAVNFIKSNKGPYTAEQLCSLLHLAYVAVMLQKDENIEPFVQSISAELQVFASSCRAEISAFSSIVQIYWPGLLGSSSTSSPRNSVDSVQTSSAMRHVDSLLSAYDGIDILEKLEAKSVKLKRSIHDAYASKCRLNTHNHLCVSFHEFLSDNSNEGFRPAIHCALELAKNGALNSPRAVEVVVGEACMRLCKNPTVTRTFVSKVRQSMADNSTIALHMNSHEEIIGTTIKSLDQELETRRLSFHSPQTRKRLRPGDGTPDGSSSSRLSPSLRNSNIPTIPEDTTFFPIVPTEFTPMIAYDGTSNPSRHSLHQGSVSSSRSSHSFDDMYSFSGANAKRYSDETMATLSDVMSLRDPESGFLPDVDMSLQGHPQYATPQTFDMHEQFLRGTAPSLEVPIPSTSYSRHTSPSAHSSSSHTHSQDRSHTHTDRSEDVVACKICLKKYTGRCRNSNLKSHMKSRHPELFAGDPTAGKQVCHLCQNEFARRDSLLVHWRTVHKLSTEHFPKM